MFNEKKKKIIIPNKETKIGKIIGWNPEEFLSKNNKNLYD